MLPELFDRASLAAVLSEWLKTVAELPLIIRRAVEMGLFSSAQLTRFLAMDVRPSIVRNIARRLPDSVSSPPSPPSPFPHVLLLSSSLPRTAPPWAHSHRHQCACTNEFGSVLDVPLGSVGGSRMHARCGGGGFVLQRAPTPRTRMLVSWRISPLCSVLYGISCGPPLRGDGGLSAVVGVGFVARRCRASWWDG